MFGDADAGIPDAANCLVVHTQKASFTLGWRSHNLWNIGAEQRDGYIPIRTKEYGLVGDIVLSEHSAPRLNACGQTEVSFIALSAGPDQDIRGATIKQRLERPSNNMTTSEFFGCPCSYQIGEAVGLVHIMECPKHPDFSAPILYHTYPLSIGEGDHLVALTKHLADVSYLDIDGGLLHHWARVPELNVMLIAPSTSHGAKQQVYQRLGLGRIYLKRWVEAFPSLETCCIRVSRLGILSVHRPLWMLVWSDPVSVSYM